MDKNKIKKRHAEKKTRTVTIRLTPTMSRWLRKENYSPTAIFHEAVKSLGFKQ